jgi:hypothetical protein
MEHWEECPEWIEQQMLQSGSYQRVGGHAMLTLDLWRKFQCDMDWASSAMLIF